MKLLSPQLREHVFTCEAEDIFDYMQLAPGSTVPDTQTMLWCKNHQLSNVWRALRSAVTNMRPSVMHQQV